MRVNYASVDFRHEFGKLIRQGMEKETYPFLEYKSLPSCEKQLWKKYRREVWKITEKQNLKKLKDYDKRAFNGYHLDHKVSIWYGYKNKLDPKMIGGIDNLEFIPSTINMVKGRRCNFKNAKCLQTVLFI